MDRNTHTAPFTTTTLEKSLDSVNKYVQYADYIPKVQKVMYFRKDMRGWNRLIKLFVDSLNIVINISTILRYHGDPNHDYILDWSNFMAAVEVLGIFIFSILFLTMLIKFIRCDDISLLDYRLGNIAWSSWNWMQKFSLFAFIKVFQGHGLFTKIARSISKRLLGKPGFKKYAIFSFHFIFHSCWIVGGVILFLLKIRVVSFLFLTDVWTFANVSMAVGYLVQLNIYQGETDEISQTLKFFFFSDVYKMHEDETIIQQKFMTSILCHLLLSKGGTKPNVMRKLWALSLFLTLTSEDLQKLLVDVEEDKAISSSVHTRTYTRIIPEGFWQRKKGKNDASEESKYVEENSFTSRDDISRTNTQRSKEVFRLC